MISVIEHFNLGGLGGVGGGENQIMWIYEIFASNAQSEPLPNTTSSV